MKVSPLGETNQWLQTLLGHIPVQHQQRHALTGEGEVELGGAVGHGDGGRCAGERGQLAGGGHRLRSGITLSEGEQISVVLRPEQLKLVTTVPQGADNVLHGHVRHLTFQGGSIECEVDLGGSLSLRVPMPTDLDLDKGARVAVVVRTLEGSVFRTGPADTQFHEIA